MVCLWTVAMWFLTGWYLNQRTQDEIRHAKADANVSTLLVTSYLNRHLDILRLVPDVIVQMPTVVSPLLKAENKKAIPVPRSNDAAGQQLSQQLGNLVRRGMVKDIMLLNSRGRCIAAIGFHENIQRTCAKNTVSDMHKDPHDADDIWFWVWPRTPGLFHAAPVMISGQKKGVIVAKIDVGPILASIAQANAFVTDENGVVILARSPELLMHTMPDARIMHLSQAARIRRYSRTHFVPIRITPASEYGSGPVHINNTPTPSIMVTRSFGDGRFTVHVTQEIDRLNILRRDRLILFALLSVIGAKIVLLALSFFISVRRTRRHNEEITHLNNLLAAQASTDALTGITNRRHFMEILDKERQRATRSGSPFCLMQIDFDFFKKINDSYGHAAGDEALRHAVTQISHILRAADVLARTGGDEFTAFLPDTDTEQAQQVGNRICALVAQTPLQTEDQQIPVTLSIGVAEWDIQNKETIAHLFRRADAALYSAKEAGRGQTHSAPAPSGHA